MHGRVWIAGLLLAIPALAGCIGDNEGDVAEDLMSQGRPEGPGPWALFTVTPAGDGAFSFDASASEGDALSYEWDFGDGEKASGEKVDHTYGVANAVFGAMLTVTDAAGLKDRAVQGVTLGSGENAVPTVSLTLDENWIAPGGTVSAQAQANDADKDDLHVRIGTAFLGAGAPANLLPSAAGGHQHHGAGGDAAYAPAENGFDSPLFVEGDRYEVTLDKPGIYDYHCHPHPWMTGAIIVVDDPMALGGKVVLTAWQAQNYLPRTVLVKPGTTLVWENPDPAPHTVTLSQNLPLDSFVASGPSASPKLDKAGVYAIIAVATDSKGASGFAHQLVKVSADVPPDVVTEAWSGEATLPAALEPVAPPPVHAFTLEWPGTASVNFSWSGPLPAELSNVHVDVYSGGETPIASTAGEPLSLTLTPGIYTFRVMNEVGVLVAYEIGISVLIQAEPDFGAPPAGDGHDHQH